MSIIKIPTKSSISGGLIRETDRKKKERQVEGDTKKGEGDREKKREVEGRGRGSLLIGANIRDYSFHSQS